MALSPTSSRGSTFNGGTITDALDVEPGAAENDAAITANATSSGNPRALEVAGLSLLDGSGLPGDVLLVKRAGTTVSRVDVDGKTRLTPTANDTPTQPALDVDAATAIATLFRLRTNGTTRLSVDKAGVVTAGSWLFGSDTGTQILAAGSGSDVELCDSSSNMVVQVTDDGKLGFFNHAASAKPTVAGAKLPSDVVLASLLTALVGLGLIVDNST